MDNAERIVETIQDIKKKIPSDPFEAELIFMAEMVAEDNEKNGKGQTSKNQVEKEKEKQEASAPYGKKKNLLFRNRPRSNRFTDIYIFLFENTQKCLSWKKSKRNLNNSAFSI